MYIYEYGRMTFLTRSPITLTKLFYSAGIRLLFFIPTKLYVKSSLHKKITLLEQRKNVEFHTVGNPAPCTE